MNKGLIIGASADSIHAIEVAQSMGIYVIAMDGNENAPGCDVADEKFIVDISDVDAVCRIVEKVKPDFIIPIPIGRYLSTMGAINEKYHLPGVKAHATACSTDKYLFHKVLAQNGLRNIKAGLLNGETDFSEIDVPLPSIVKPRFGSGSRDVHWLEQKEEQDDFFTTYVRGGVMPYLKKIS